MQNPHQVDALEVVGADKERDVLISSLRIPEIHRASTSGGFRV
jgi:hypothetical protein